MSQNSAAQENGIPSAENSTELKIEELLDSCPAIQIAPKGYSMYPLLIPGRDQVILEKTVPGKLRRGDVILYRRQDKTLVLHRLCKITPKGYYTVGDNQTEVEGPLQAEQIKGRMTAFVRKGRTIRVSHPIYRLAAGIWLALRPVRDPIKRPLAVLRKCFRGRGKDSG